MGFWIISLRNKLGLNSISAGSSIFEFLKYKNLPLSAFFMGLLVLLLSGPLLAVVAASIVGLAVVPFALAGLIVAGLLGMIGVTRLIGRNVITESEPGSRFQSWPSYVIGFVIIILTSGNRLGVHLL